MSLIEILYEKAYTIRRSEEALLDLYQAGRIYGTLHTCIGQEICAVGVLGTCTTENAIVLSNHRGHGHYLSFTNDLNGLIFELLGDPRGVCGGVGGSQHLTNIGYYSNGIQGGMVPVAAGIALSEKLKNSNKIVYVFMGDGTMGQGVVYETFNISQLYSLRVIFVLENNKYAQSTPVHLAHAGILENRAGSFGIKTVTADGNDIDEVLNAIDIAKGHLDMSSRPVFLVLNTYRLMAHSKGDDMRDPKEVEMAWENDPLSALRKKLTENQASYIEKSVELRLNTVLESVNAS